MPRPPSNKAGSARRKPAQVVQTPFEQVTQLANGGVRITVGGSCRLGAGYQSYEIQSSVSFETDANNVETGLEVARTVVQTELGSQIDDARATLGMMIDIRNEVEG